MNYIALDTITPIISISAQGQQGLVTIEHKQKGQHIEKFPLLLEQILPLAGFKKNELEAIIIAEGPGSFTGLRLSWSIARALELATNCKIITVPPLTCYAFPYQFWQGLLLSVLDAKRNRFYVQAFRNGQIITKVQDATLTMIKELHIAEEPLLIVGPDVSLFRKQLIEKFPYLDALINSHKTNIASKLFLDFALQNPQNCTLINKDFTGPLYIRKSDAEESL